MSDQSSTTADGGAVEYRDIPGFPGYRVGSDGSVWSCLKLIPLGRCRGTRSVISDEWRRRRVTLVKGYLGLQLRRGGRGVTLYVHQAVMLGFVGPCPEGHEVAHENGNRFDNSPGNLSYKTYKENHRDMYRHGTRPLGERVHNSKLTEDAVRAIRVIRVRDNTPIVQIARQYEVSEETIRRAINGQLWSHVV